MHEHYTLVVTSCPYIRLVFSSFCASGDLSHLSFSLVIMGNNKSTMFGPWGMFNSARRWHCVLRNAALTLSIQSRGNMRGYHSGKWYSCNGCLYSYRLFWATCEGIQSQILLFSLVWSCLHTCVKTWVVLCKTMGCWYSSFVRSSSVCCSTSTFCQIIPCHMMPMLSNWSIYKQKRIQSLDQTFYSICCPTYCLLLLNITCIYTHLALIPEKESGS